MTNAKQLTLKQEIEELEVLAGMEVQPYDCMDCVSYDHAFDMGDDAGCQRIAQNALKIITKLQEVVEMQDQAFIDIQNKEGDAMQIKKIIEEASSKVFEILGY